MKNFFRIIESKDDTVRYILEKPAQLLLHNICNNWLRFINIKTSKLMDIYNKEQYFQEKNNFTLPVGFLNNKIPDLDSGIIMGYNLTECCPVNDSKLNLNIIVPKQDVMQYLIQWQRYRKFWWSSITTTPSLFTVNDIKYIEDSAKVDIIASYPWGKQTVETVQINPSKTAAKHSACLNFAISLDGALLYILQDALTNQNKEYLRLHRLMAPYKISFALNHEETSSKVPLQELATLLHLRLKLKKISTWLPDWNLPSKIQMKENFQMGVTYTAVLNEQTLENGIFHLLSSSTMLKEEVHVADFDDYATVLFGN